MSFNRNNSARDQVPWGAELANDPYSRRERQHVQMWSHDSTPCSPGTSHYSVQDFQDVPVYFAGLMKYNFELEPLALQFSSADNAYRIHKEVSRVVYEQYNEWIAKQDNQVLAATMFSAFKGYRTRYKTGDMQKDLDYLNSLVLDVLIPRALANLRQLIGYLPLWDRVAVPLPLPVNLSSKGQNGKNSYDITRFLP